MAHDSLWTGFVNSYLGGARLKQWRWERLQERYDTSFRHYAERMRVLEATVRVWEVRAPMTRFMTT